MTEGLKNWKAKIMVEQAGERIHDVELSDYDREGVILELTRALALTETRMEKESDPILGLCDHCDLPDCNEPAISESERENGEKIKLCSYHLKKMANEEPLINFGVVNAGYWAKLKAKMEKKPEPEENLPNVALPVCIHQCSCQECYYKGIRCKKTRELCRQTIMAGNCPEGKKLEGGT